MGETFARHTEIGRGYGTLHIHPPLLAGALLITGLLLHLALGHHGAFPFLQLVGLLLVAAGTGLSCYAAALFAALLEYAREQGAHRVWLRATADGEPIYRRAGFVPSTHYLEYTL